MNKGNLLPDSLILRVIREHFMKAHSEGTDRFLLDGFPRTVQQAAALEQIASVKLAVNLGLREEVGCWCIDEAGLCGLVPWCGTT